MSAAPTFTHQLVLQVLNRSLDRWTEEHGTGTAMIAPPDVVLDANALQPDLFVLMDENRA